MRIIFNLTGIIMKLRDDEIMDDYEEELLNKKELRKKKDKKRAHRQTKSPDVEECTKESFKKMKDEIDELRKRELDRTKELDELKKRIDEQSCLSANSSGELSYALNFSKDTYLSKGFIESAKWIKEVIAQNLIEKMNEEANKSKFDVILRSKRASTYLGIRTCARYNRGEMCNFGKVHSTHKPDFAPNQRSPENASTYREHRLRKDASTGSENNDHPTSSVMDRLGTRNEMRLHACTLCMEAFGSANGHSVLNCPWILQKNWI
jgi:hypothetical protein